MPYYGLFIPSKSGALTATPTTTAAAANSANEQTSNRNFVFETKDAALEVLRSNKDGRMREFQNEDDAVKYAQTGYEEVTTQRFADPKGASTAAVEKAAFRAPTKQELIEFRKIIESGDVERVKAKIWENPRYLVSSGDTPTTLKEGYRYNALHVCALSRKPKVAELILKTVSDPKFVDMLTGKKNDEQMCKELCKNLLDYYLNIPEKGRSETPLHLATKIGSIEMVELLTSYVECRMTMNSEGKCPKEIICTRQPGPNPETARKIETLLEERFYVPVLRSIDNAIPPEIGTPFQLNNPPNLNTDPLSPEVKILALAGPMPQEQANQFRRRWKTPPRHNSSSPIANNPFISPRSSKMNITPTKHNFNGIDSSAHTPTAKTLQRRALFNSSPLNLSVTITTATPVQQQQQQPENNNTNANVVVAENVDAVDNAATFAQNRNYNGNNEAYFENNKISILTIEYNNNSNNKNNNVNKIEEVENELTESQLKQQQEENAETTNNINATEKCEQLEQKQFGIICPSTPIRHMKKSLFFDYRDPIQASAIDSPTVFGNYEGRKANQNTNIISTTTVNSNTNTTNTLTPTKKVNLFNDSVQMLQRNGQLLLDSPGFKERHVKISDREKGLEVIGRELAREQNIGWREYWDFLDEYLDISTEAGLLKLENYFAQRVKETEKRTIKTTMATATVAMDDVCSALEKFGFSRDDSGGNAQLGGAGAYLRNGFQNAERFEMQQQQQSGAGAIGTATTPYTCVEKSLQVFAKRMTKTIIHNVENVVCINDTLLSELKRLKSLICSFKEDKRFLDIHFSKVHSRIANLISIYLQNSQEVTIATTAKILVVIQNLQSTVGERREHIECVCSKIFQKLMNQGTQQQILPENLKTEESCSRAWFKEQECECQWENNLSRKTSRRNRIEARFKSSSSQNLTPSQTKTKIDGQAINEANEYRCGNSGNDSSEEDFLSMSESESDSDEIWYTPSNSPRLFEEPQAEYKIYVHGNEPTKRDLDVLNAIFHIELDEKKFPNVLAWKTVMLRFPNEEMDYFPSPAIIKKSHNLNSARKLVNYTPSKLETSSTIVAPMTPNTSRNEKAIEEQQQPTAAKQLFSATTVRSKMFGSILGAGGGVDNPANGPPRTPLNKLRGLFSSYRTNVENSPIPSSPVITASSPFLQSNNSGDDSKNLSLFNISTAE